MKLSKLVSSNGLKKDKKIHYSMTKGSIYQESVPIVNIYVSNTGSPKYRNQKLTGLKGETSSNTIIVGDLKNLLSIINRSSKINK